MSTDQDEAVNLARDWFNGPKSHRPFILNGAAGTGKTHVARRIADTLAPGRTLFLAPTGKATQVLAQKGCDPVATIHSTIYHVGLEREQAIEAATEKIADLEGQLDPAVNDGDIPMGAARRAIEKELAETRRWLDHLTQPTWVLREEIRKEGGPEAPNPHLLIVDECSMVGAELADDLATFGIPTLCLGDPYQLPPVKADIGYPQAADITLETIHRYGDSAPLLDLATAARHGRRLPTWVPQQSTAGMWRAGMGGKTWRDLTGFDTIIVGRNATRWAAIKALRVVHGREPGRPVAGDVVMVLRNEPSQDLVNGQTATVRKVERGPLGRSWSLTTDMGEWVCHPGGFLGQQEQKVAEAQRTGPLLPVTFANAITAHKAQGSEWDSVCVIDESVAFRADGRKWLYTAVTRAKERCLVLPRAPQD